jgi:hypothetical protein
MNYKNISFGSPLLAAFVQGWHGLASGDHALFLAHRIDAITISTIAGDSDITSPLLAVLDSLFRLGNGLSERLHLSYYFYIMLTPTSFLPLSVYSLPFIVFLLGIILRAFNCILSGHAPNPWSLSLITCIVGLVWWALERRALALATALAVVAMLTLYRCGRGERRALLGVALLVSAVAVCQHGARNMFVALPVSWALSLACAAYAR